MSKDATFYINFTDLKKKQKEIQLDCDYDSEESKDLYQLAEQQNPDMTFNRLKLVHHYCEFSSQVSAFRKLLDKYEIEYQTL